VTGLVRPDRHQDDGETSVTAGDGVTHTYTITVSNAGPSDATNVTVGEASFPVGFTMGTVSSSQGSCAAFRQPRHDRQRRQRHDQRRLHRAELHARAPDQHRLGRRRRHNTGDTGASDDTTVTASSDLTVTKTDGETSVTAGDGVTHTYTITVSNAGPSDATNVTVGEASFPVGSRWAPSAPARAAARPSRATSARCSRR